MQKVFLLHELVGGSERKETDVFKDLHQVSQIKWTFYRNKIDAPSKRAFQVWKLFVIWLKRQSVKTIYDFYEHAH